MAPSEAPLRHLKTATPRRLFAVQWLFPEEYLMVPQTPTNGGAVEIRPALGGALVQRSAIMSGLSAKRR